MPYGEGTNVRRVLRADDLHDIVPRLAAMTGDERSRIPGVSEGRSEQMLAGAIVAEAVVDLFEMDELVICPWALREGLILQRLDGLPR